MQPEVGLPKPDIVIYLDITTEKAAARAAYGEERYETREFQERVRENFFQIMASSSLSCEENHNTWHVFDATRSIEELHEEIKAAVHACIAQVTHHGLPVQDISFP